MKPAKNPHRLRPVRDYIQRSQKDLCTSYFKTLVLISLEQVSINMQQKQHINNKHLTMNPGKMQDSYMYRP